MSKFGTFRKAVLAAAMMLAVGIGSANAVTLWYSGDADGVSGLPSEGNSSSIVQAMVYDEFTVPVGGWTIEEVWANQAVTLGDENPPSAYWEIRSGLSDGNGGTLVASGTDPCSFTATGGSPIPGFPEYLVDVSGLSLALAPGTYWLGVAPVDDGSGVFYDETTSGLNAIGPADNGNSFFDSYYFGYAFVAADDPTFPLGSGAWDFSMGVAGEPPSVTVIPEPTTILLLAAGICGMGLRRYRGRI